MSLFETDYNSGGSTDSNSSGSGDGDYEDRYSLKLANYAIVSFEVTRLAEYTHGQNGQSMIVDLDDVEVIHGAAYDRFYNDDEEEDMTKKVFGFDSWFDIDENGQLAEEFDEEFVPKRDSETHVGNNYPYELIDYTLEEDDNVLDLGNMTMWMSNSTKYRTFAKVVTPDGHDIVADKEDDFDWLATEEPELRDDLEGRRIVMFFKQESFTPDGDDEEVEYFDATILDEKTGEGITIQNGSSGGSSDDSGSSSGDSGSIGGDDSDDGGLPDGVPDEADQIIDFMADTDETAKENVESLIEGEAPGQDYDTDAVIAEIESRME